MKINIICEYPPEVIGGGGILAEELVKRLTKGGYKITVISWRGEQIPEFEKRENLDVYRVSRFSRISPIHKLRFGYLAGKKVKNLQGVIHAHLFIFPLDKKRTIYTFHATQLGELRALQMIPDRSLTSLISKGLKKLYIKWEKYIIKHCYKLIAVSQTIKNELLELGARPEKIEVISNPINLNKYYRIPEEEIKILRSKYIKNPETKIVFSIGRLLPRKGFQYLIQTIAIIAKQRDIRLLIAGEGSYKAKLVELASKLGLKDKVIFLGRILSDRVREFYSIADVTVVPSLYEPFGLVLLEAMACGSPLVCTDVSDFPIIAGESAVYAKAQNPESLAQKILCVLNNKKAAKQMSKFGLGKVKEYSWDKYIDRLEKIYQQVDKNPKV